MDHPNNILREITQCHEQIDNHQRQIEKLKRLVTELMCLPIDNSEGDVTSYADWQ